MDDGVKNGCVFPPRMRRIYARYLKAHYPAEREELLRRTEEIYAQLKAEAPDIGGSKNKMAYNLDMFLSIAALHEASDRRIGAPDVDEMADMLFSRFRFIGKLLDFNKPWVAKAMYRYYAPYAKKANAKKASGEWNNTWGIVINPEGRTEGCAFHLIGCPLADFAKAHGYLDLLPALCAADHKLPPMVHAKLIRTHTCALGSEVCDYWYVGDKSDAAKQYADSEIV